LQDSLDFFELKFNYTKEELKQKYHELAKKYHPDSSEFTSAEIFLEVLKHKEILETNLLSKETKELKTDYEIYKEAKKIENESIRIYFQKRNLNHNLSSPELDYEIELKINLEKAKNLYLKIIYDFPNSIWITDAKDSIQSLSNWLR
jgi:hypothetical protein